jgi:hypothetical protein
VQAAGYRPYSPTVIQDAPVVIRGPMMLPGTRQADKKAPRRAPVNFTCTVQL